jgi:hypothetical protein
LFDEARAFGDLRAHARSSLTDLVEIWSLPKEAFKSLDAPRVAQRNDDWRFVARLENGWKRCTGTSNRCGGGWLCVLSSYVPFTPLIEFGLVVSSTRPNSIWPVNCEAAK